MKTFQAIFLLVGVFLVVWACEYSKLPEPQPKAFCETTEVTYNNQVKPIIDKACAIPGCHLSGTKAPGDFATYESMKPFLKDSEFKFYVIDLVDDPDVGMPPDWATNPGPKDLTDEEFEIVECWVSNGYPE